MTNDYYKNLPKKRMGAGAIFLNEKDEILIVKPSYKDFWSMAGGVVVENESPKDACIREVKEEIGINLKDASLLCIDYCSNKEGNGDSLQFIFFGGVLTEKEIKEIKIDGKELVDYRFVKVEEALSLLSEKLKVRIPRCLEALKNNAVVYFENGK
ncbi:MAG: NUDIX hydrolase [bacterium]